MSTSLLLVLVLVAAYTDATLRSLERIQGPIPNVNVQMLTGEWFATFRKPPCSFKGSNEFMNVHMRYTLGGNNAIQSRGTWGSESGYCNIMNDNLVLTKTPGVFMYKDSYGNSLSSRMVLIGTDYKTFHVLWGCTKFSVFGERCEDPCVFVNTRAPRPNKRTIGHVNAILMKRFGMNINQMDKVFFNGAC